MVRVAALVAFFTTFSLAEVFDFDCLPLTLLLTHVPRMVASVEVTAVSTAFHTFDIMPGFLAPPTAPEGASLVFLAEGSCVPPSGGDRGASFVSNS